MSALALPQQLVYNLFAGSSNFSLNKTGTALLSQAQINEFGNDSLGRELVAVSGGTFLAGSNYEVREYNRWGSQIGASLNPGAGISFGDKGTIDSRGNVSIIGAPLNAGATGLAYVYGVSGTSSPLFLKPYTEIGNVMADDTTDGRGFGVGTSVLSEGHYLVGTDPTDNSLVENLYNFRQRGPEWTSINSLVSGLLLAGSVETAKLGTASALSDTTAAVGAADYDGRGAVFVYNATDSETDTGLPGDRTPIATLQPRDIGSLDAFGSAVALYGDSSSLSLLAGAPGKKDDTGAAYVFTGVGERWSQEFKLVGDTAGEAFGASVDLHGDTAVVGAPDGDAVYVFVRLGNIWIQEGDKIEGLSGTQFGSSVTIQNGTILVGAPESGTSGEVFVYNREVVAGAVVWTQVGSALTGTGVAAGARFGESVNLSDGRAVIGAPGERDNTTTGGAAYVFTRDAGVWAQSQKLDLGNEAAVGDRFGFSVAIEFDRIVVGAPDRDHDFGSDPGQDGWVLETPIDPLFGSDTSAGDQAGYSVALSGDLALIGAPQLLGRGTVNPATDGAGYAFVRNVDPPLRVVYPEAQSQLLNGATANTVEGYLGTTVTELATLTFFDIDTFSVFTGAENDTVTVGEAGLTAYGLRSFSVDLDGGNDMINVLSPDLDTPAAGVYRLTIDLEGLAVQLLPWAPMSSSTATSWLTVARERTR
jgi:hypothetical protein